MWQVIPCIKSFVNSFNSHSRPQFQNKSAYDMFVFFYGADAAEALGLRKNAAKDERTAFRSAENFAGSAKKRTDCYERRISTKTGTKFCYAVKNSKFHSYSKTLFSKSRKK